MNAKKIKEIKNNLANFIIYDIEEYSDRSIVSFNSKLPREIIEHWIHINNSGEKLYSGFNIQFLPDDYNNDSPGEFKRSI